MPKTGDSPLSVLPGWFTLDSQSPQLLGSRCTACGSYYFPKIAGYCRNPDCGSETFDEVPLSRTGKLWSYTDACYQPPEPFIAANPFVPFAIAAVELGKEKMVVLGPVVAGVAAASLKVGMTMELAIEPLADGKLTWKWRPAEQKR